MPKKSSNDSKTTSGPKKSLGQHWLKDRAILDYIADLAADNAAPKNLCVEVGPGLGFLTSSLLKRFEKVIAVELDSTLAKNLPKSFPGKNLEVVEADILACDFPDAPFVLAGNIPYYLTSQLLLKIAYAKNPPIRSVLLIQKEVAEKIASHVGVLGKTLENRLWVTLGATVLRDKFTPPPKVDSAVVILTPHAPLISEEAIALLRRGYSSPRKKLLNNLNLPSETLLPIFKSLGLSPSARPSDLTLTDWQKLYDHLHTGPSSGNGSLTQSSSPKSS